jgi:hypothetical protein
MPNTPLSNNFAPGAYTMEYISNGGAPATGHGPDGNVNDMGLVEGVRMLNRTALAQMIQSDLYGKSDIEGVYQGAQMALAMTLKEWGLNQRAALWPYGPSDFGQMGIVGRLLTAMTGHITLTAVAGTPAASAGGGLHVIDLPFCILAPDTEVGILLGNEQRDIPVVFKVFPYFDGYSVRWFAEE